MIKKTTGVVFTVAVLLVCLARVSFASVEDGDRLAKQGDNFAAVEAYEKALKAKPDDAAVLLKVAELCDSMKWYGRALIYWEKLLAAEPDGANAGKAKERAAFAHRWIGVFFYETGETLDLVLERLDSAVKLSPTYFDALYWKGRILFETGKFDEAAKVLAEAVKAAPKGNKLAAWLLEEAKGAGAHGEAYTIYSGAYKYFEKNEYDKALELYRKAAELNPDFARPLEYIARIYMVQEKFEEAAAYWDKVLAKEPGNKRAEWFRKVALKELNGKQE